MAQFNISAQAAKKDINATIVQQNKRFDSTVGQTYLTRIPAIVDSIVSGFSDTAVVSVTVSGNLDDARLAITVNVNVNAPGVAL